MVELNRAPHLTEIWKMRAASTTGTFGLLSVNFKHWLSLPVAARPIHEIMKAVHIYLMQCPKTQKLLWEGAYNLENSGQDFEIKDSLSSLYQLVKEQEQHYKLNATRAVDVLIDEG